MGGITEGNLPHRDVFAGEVAKAMAEDGYFGRTLEAYSFGVDDGGGWRALRFEAQGDAAACAYAAALAGARTTNVRSATLRTYDESDAPEAELNAALAQAVSAAIGEEFGEALPELALAVGEVPTELAWTAEKGFFGFAREGDGARKPYTNAYFPTVLERWLEVRRAGDAVTEIMRQPIKNGNRPAAKDALIALLGGAPLV